jgi:hypothetical protein
MTTIFTPLSWYWTVAGSTTQVWSSASLSYISVTDAGYIAWLAAGNTPGQISVDDLAHVMIMQWLPAFQGQGIQLASTGTPVLNGTYGADLASIAQASVIAADIANGDGLPGGSSTFTYVDAFGVHGPFDSAHFLAAYKGLKNYVYSLTQDVITLVNGGSASLPSQPVTIA